MNEATATQETPAAAPTVVITDLNQFVQMLVSWHSQKVKALEHMLQVPDGTEMIIDGGTPAILTGDMLVGFKAGLELALMELGILPFLYETEPEAVAAPAAPVAQAADV